MKNELLVNGKYINKEFFTKGNIYNIYNSKNTYKNCLCVSVFDNKIIFHNVTDKLNRIELSSQDIREYNIFNITKDYEELKQSRKDSNKLNDFHMYKKSKNISYILELIDGRLNYIITEKPIPNSVQNDFKYFTLDDVCEYLDSKEYEYILYEDSEEYNEVNDIDEVFNDDAEINGKIYKIEYLEHVRDDRHSLYCFDIGGQDIYIVLSELYPTSLLEDKLIFVKDVHNEEELKQFIYDKIGTLVLHEPLTVEVYTSYRKIKF